MEPDSPTSTPSVVEMMAQHPIQGCSSWAIPSMEQQVPAGVLLMELFML